MLDPFINLFKFMMSIWDNVIFPFIDRVGPKLLFFEWSNAWWQILLVGLFWLALYGGVAMFYFKVVGFPVWRALFHLHDHGMKALPGWQAVIYLIVYFLYHAMNKFHGTIDGLSIGLLAIIVIHYLVKAKWRIIYFPLLQALVILFWVGAVFLFLPVIIIMTGLMFAGVTVQGISEPTRYRCSSCGRVYRSDGLCQCGGELSSI